MRVLLVVSADRSRPRRGPLADHEALAARLDCDVVDASTVFTHPLARLVARVAGRGLPLAWRAFARRGRYDAIFTDGEHVGIPLALLLRASRSRVRHVTIGHRIRARSAS